MTECQHEKFPVAFFKIILISRPLYFLCFIQEIENALCAFMYQSIPALPISPRANHGALDNLEK